MENRVIKLLSMSIQDILKSPEYSMMLLKTYSVLYMGGSPPQTCSKSQTNYYNQLKRNGIKKAKAMEIKTCKVIKDGLLHVTSLQKHILLSEISDSDAIFLLKSKTLKEEDFEILPEGYKKPMKKEIAKEEKVKNSK